MNMEILDCAERIRLAYLSKKSDQLALPNVSAIKPAGDGAEAYLSDDGILVIPGTNDLSDWRKYNLKLWSWQMHRATGGFRFHAGFLKHANLIYEWVKDKNVRGVTGHSLGAASAQILGPILDVPALCFAAPRVAVLGHSYRKEDQILVINRTDDAITSVPFFLFRHLGTVQKLRPKKAQSGADHKIEKYVEALTGWQDYAHLPGSWGGSGDTRFA